MSGGLNWDRESSRRKVREHGSDRAGHEHIPRKSPPKQRMIKNAQRRELHDLGFKAPGNMSERRAARTIDRLRILGVTRSEIARRARGDSPATRHVALSELSERLEAQYVKACEKARKGALTEAECAHDLRALETARRCLAESLRKAGLQRKPQGSGTGRLSGMAACTNRTPA